MAKQKRKVQKAAGNAKERHKRAGRVVLNQNAPLPQGLEARLPIPKTSGKYHTYFELVENADKKKKLDYQVDNRRPQGLAARDSPWCRLRPIGTRLPVSPLSPSATLS